VLAFGEMFPLIQSFYMSGSYGDITIFSALGMSQGLFALLLIAAAVLAFVLTTRIERRVNPESAARSLPVRYHRLAAIGLLGLGIVLAFLPDYKTRLLEKARIETAGNQHPVKSMTADELAFRIIDQDPTLQIIDIRDGSEYAKMSLPGALNIPMQSMFGKEWGDVLAQAQKKKVLIANDEAVELQAAQLTRLLGYENFLVLQGGFGEFTRCILNPHTPKGALTRSEADVYRFRQNAAPLIIAMIKEQKAPKNVERHVKKIVGGCGA
jgi:uncharacterized protein